MDLKEIEALELAKKVRDDLWDSGHASYHGANDKYKYMLVEAAPDLLAAAREHAELVTKCNRLTELVREAARDDFDLNGHDWKSDDDRFRADEWRRRAEDELK